MIIHKVRNTTEIELKGLIQEILTGDSLYQRRDFVYETKCYIHVLASLHWSSQNLARVLNCWYLDLLSDLKGGGHICHVVALNWPVKSVSDHNKEPKTSGKADLVTWFWWRVKTAVPDDSLSLEAIRLVWHLHVTIFRVLTLHVHEIRSESSEVRSVRINDCKWISFVICIIC